MLDTPWRRLTAAIFDAPESGRILVRVQYDVDHVERYIAGAPGAPRTLGLVHFVAAAAARAIAEEVPEMNGYLRWGRVRTREGTTVSVTVPLPGDGGLMAIPLRDAAHASASALATTLWDALRALRERHRRQGLLAEYVLARVPWPLRRPVFRAARGLARLGLPMGRFDLAPESLGAVIVTSMEPMARQFPTDRGTFDVAFVPQFPAAREATVISMIPPCDVPAVVDGEVVVRRRGTLGFTFDHRVVDGAEIGRFIQALGRQLVDPAALDRPAVAAGVSGGDGAVGRVGP